MEDRLRDWFIEMGYPIDLLPDKSDFQKICKGVMNNVWEEVLKKTKSRQSIRQARLNLLLHKIKNQNTEYQSNTSNYASKQIDLWDKKKLLEEKISILDDNILDVENELNKTQYKMKMECANVQMTLENKQKQTRKYISLIQEKYEQLNKELTEYNIMYETAKKLNLVRNNSSNFNDEIFKKLEKLVTNENNALTYSEKKIFDQNKKQSIYGDAMFSIQQRNLHLIPTFSVKDQNINEEYIRNFSSNNLQFWESIMKSKLNTVQYLKTLISKSSNIIPNSLAVPPYLGNICSDYNNYKLEYIYLNSIMKKSESQVQILNNSDSNCTWTQTYLNKMGFIAAINSLRNEIENLKKIYENKNVDPNSIIQATNNLRIEIDREKESVESKLLKFNAFCDKLLNLPKVFENSVQKLLCDTKDLQKKYFDMNENFSGEVELVSKSPEVYLENNLPTRVIESFDTTVIPVQVLVKIIDNPEQSPVSTVVNFFQEKLRLEIMNKWKLQEFKELEEVNLNKSLNSNIFNINKENGKQLVEHFEAIKKESLNELVLQGKFDEIFEFWEDQPMKYAISETRLFNSLPFSFYEKKYNDFYNNLCD